MTKENLNAAVLLAQDQTVRFIDDNGQHIEDISMFWGFALPSFKTVVATTRQLAALVRWQCLRTNGSMDSDNLQEIASIGRHKFNIVG